MQRQYIVKMTGCVSDRLYYAGEAQNIKVADSAGWIVTCSFDMFRKPTMSLFLHASHTEFYQDVTF